MIKTPKSGLAMAVHQVHAGFRCRPFGSRVQDSNEMHGPALPEGFRQARRGCGHAAPKLPWKVRFRVFLPQTLLNEYSKPRQIPRTFALPRRRSFPSAEYMALPRKVIRAFSCMPSYASFTSVSTCPPAAFCCSSACRGNTRLRNVALVPVKNRQRKVNARAAARSFQAVVAAPRWSAPQPPAAPSGGRIGQDSGETPPSKVLPLYHHRSPLRALYRPRTAACAANSCAGRGSAGAAARRTEPPAIRRLCSFVQGAFCSSETRPGFSWRWSQPVLLLALSRRRSGHRQQRFLAGGQMLIEGG